MAITFLCQARLPLSPEQIAAQILDLSNWPDFQGYGWLPGVESAVFKTQTPDHVGTRIRVENTDGSTHVEEIIQWEPQQTLQLRLCEFSPPLSHLASEFLETWELQLDEDATCVTRRFELHAKTWFARPVLWMISLLLRRAIQRHLQQMQ